MLFRFRYTEQGGHTHVRVFAGKGAASLGKCGDLVFRNEEWIEFTAHLGSGVEVLPEDAQPDPQIETPQPQPDGWPTDYLGDAVYSSFDGYHIWLKTGDGNNQQIALEPAVYLALRRYAKRIWGENA